MTTFRVSGSGLPDEAFAVPVVDPEVQDVNAATKQSKAGMSATVLRIVSYVMCFRAAALPGLNQYSKVP